ncbi:response regulator [Bradyrhizobium sp.]|uniref:response regulator n=1 Tax=Bradyrhizobium sp. TaxID=376 RepID=UPI00345D92B3
MTFAPERPDLKQGPDFKALFEAAPGLYLVLFPRVADEFNGSGETILVVEDDPLVRQYASAQLAQLGYRAILTANGPEALVEIEKGLASDLLFTDVTMPGGANDPPRAQSGNVSLWS